MVGQSRGIGEVEFVMGEGVEVVFFLPSVVSDGAAINGGDDVAEVKTCLCCMAVAMEFADFPTLPNVGAVAETIIIKGLAGRWVFGCKTMQIDHALLRVDDEVEL